jgi:bacillithiol system protein YtxJ
MGLLSRNKSEKKSSINWNKLETISELEMAIEKSFEIPVLLFKHSIRCSISSMALYRTESGWDLPQEKVMPFYLDLISHRDVSNSIAEKLNVFHASPQIILVKNGKAVLDASHNEIRVELIKEALD